jgi:hypothetical protein
MPARLVAPAYAYTPALRGVLPRGARSYPNPGSGAPSLVTSGAS